jgi:RNA polymerase sigma-70 factor (ECF subfamily)
MVGVFIHTASPKYIFQGLATFKIRQEGGFWVQLSDEALVDEVQSGSTLAFGLLMKRYERLVYRIALDYAKNPDSAMDITQNVFLKAHSNLASFAGSGVFKAWLMRIARNESITWFRRQKKDRLTDELTADNTPVLRAVQTDEVERQQQHAVIQSELKKLSDNQRVAVSLRYFEEFSVREIAQVLEVSEGNVKSILFRGLEKLRNTTTFRRRHSYAQL